MAGNSQAMTGLGIKIRIKVPPATAFAEIGEPFEITPPQQLDDEIEVTHFGSPDGVKEYIGGLTDPGECSFTINYVPGGPTETLVLAAKATRKPVPFEFEWPNGAVWAFDLLVRGFQPAAPLNDRLTAQVTGRCSGSIVREPAD
jgi:hypothetical protein